MAGTYEEQVQAFADLLDKQQKERLLSEYPSTDYEALYENGSPVHSVTIKHAKKYTRVDVGSSGKYMVEKETGAIYGIKGYGVIHRGHYYGTLDTIQEWDWSGYSGRRLAVSR